MEKWVSDCERITLYCGDCLEILPTLASGSIETIITDPPYAEISRDYGRLTESEWHALINPVMEESRRIITKTGSGVFILQPNSKKIGSLRPWLWQYLAKWSVEWNMIQDIWWWNFAALPTSGPCQGHLCRASLKICAWFGANDCFRDQDKILWEESERGKAERLSRRVFLNQENKAPSGHSVKRRRIAAAAQRKGGTTPFNVIPITNQGGNSSGDFGHGAGTPQKLADWWIRYISPPKTTILDPFMGAGTMGLAAIAQNRKFIGIEQKPEYFEISKRRIRAALVQPDLFTNIEVKGENQ